MFAYDCAEKLKAVSRLPATWFGFGSVTAATVTESETVVRAPSATTTSEPL